MNELNSIKYDAVAVTHCIVKELWYITSFSTVDEKGKGGDIETHEYFEDRDQAIYYAKIIAFCKPASSRKLFVYKDRGGIDYSEHLQDDGSVKRINWTF